MSDDHDDDRDARSLWSQVLVGVGGVAMVVGALDPLEGSVVVLVGSGLVTLGRALLVEWLWTFALTLFGVAALFALSAVGGIGGTDGHSLWWGLLLLPYPAAWLLGMANLLKRLINRVRYRHDA